MVLGSQLNEQIVPVAIHFLPKAQAPGGGFIIPLAEATDGSAATAASNATFNIDIRMLSPKWPQRVPMAILLCQGTRASRCGHTNKH